MGVRELEEVGEAAEDEALDPDRGVTSLTERERRLLESLDVGVTVFERVVVAMVARSKMQSAEIIGGSEARMIALSHVLRQLMTSHSNLLPRNPHTPNHHNHPLS